MALEKSIPSHRLLQASTWESDIASPADYDTSRQVMLNASKNYSFASKFLPQEKRHHVEALYAFLRVGDDRVDVSHRGFSSPLQAIEDWERSYWLAFETGDSHDPVLRAYLNTAVENGIPAETMETYFRAMKEDLTITRFPTFEHLMHYMNGSAIPVGRAMTYILGVRGPHTFEEALQRADSLSIAMQLSNFWRDIGQDWAIGRVYLPQEDMDFFQVSEETLEAGNVDERFVALLEFEIERAESYYDQAREGVGMLASGRWGVMNGLFIYRSILHAIRRNRYDVFKYSARPSLPRRIQLILQARWEIEFL